MMRVIKDASGERTREEVKRSIRDTVRTNWKILNDMRKVMCGEGGRKMADTHERKIEAAHTALWQVLRVYGRAKDHEGKDMLSKKMRERIVDGAKIYVKIMEGDSARYEDMVHGGDWRTVLTDAVLFGTIEECERVLAESSARELNEADGGGYTALQYCARMGAGFEDMAAKLLGMDALQVNQVDSSCQTALHMALQHAEGLDEDDDREDGNGYNKAVAKLLLADRRVRVNAVAAHGNTPLHTVVKELGEPEHVYEAIASILQYKGDRVRVCARDENGDTPMHILVRRRREVRHSREPGDMRDCKVLGECAELLRGHRSYRAGVKNNAGHTHFAVENK